MSNSIDTTSKDALPAVITLGVVLNSIWPLPFIPSALASPAIFFAAVFLFVPLTKGISSCWDFRAGNRTHHHDYPHRSLPIHRNPIYLAFVLFFLGSVLWLNNLWLLVTLTVFTSFISIMVIPREEQFLERNFQAQYSEYKATVRRWHNV